MSGAGEGGRNEVPTKNGKKSHFVGRLFGYTDSYYEKKEQAQQEMEEAERLAKLDMQRWLARMQRDEAEKEAAVAEAKTNRKQSKLQQKPQYRHRSKAQRLAPAHRMPSYALRN